MRLARAILPLVLVVSCAAPAAPATPAATAAGSPGGAAAAVAIARNFTFDPPELTVTVGTTVTWTNTDSTTHTVTSGAPGAPTGVFDGSLNASGTFSFRFTTAGTFTYFCKIHPTMRGTIVVR